MKVNPWFDRVLWATGGVVVALAAAYFLLSSDPASASATDHGEEVIIATGRIDNIGEGIFVLDTVTGDLRGWVLDSRTGKFTTAYAANVIDAMGITAQANPKFTMVTGLQVFRPSRGQSNAAEMVVYVAESTTGNVAAFGVPWNTGWRGNATPRTDTFTLLDAASFRAQSAIR